MFNSTIEEEWEDLWWIKYDANGNPFNTIYPPDHTKYGDTNDGYESDLRYCVFHLFCVCSYNLVFNYQDKEYFITNDDDGTCWSKDSGGNEKILCFRDQIEFIQNFEIGGRPFLEIMDDLEYEEFDVY